VAERHAKIFLNLTYDEAGQEMRTDAFSGCTPAARPSAAGLLKLLYLISGRVRKQSLPVPVK